MDITIDNDAGYAPPSILVVDDDPTQRMMFRKVLEKDGHSVIEAADGKEALEMFAQHHPLLILLDAVMPVMDGFETCQKLQTMEGAENTTILMATSLSADADINRAFEVGAADFIGKPINWTVLRGRVRHLLEAKLAEQRIREAEIQLRQAQKMNAIGNLSSGIAHEFNNILASVMGYTELLQEHFSHSGEERQKQYADEVYTAAERARDLVSQMQLFSQCKPGEMQLLDLTPLVKEDLKMLRSSISSTISLQQQLEPNLPQVMADPAQFQQLLTNLLINARDALGGKGEISVSLRRASQLEGLCDSCHDHFCGNYVQLQVTDNGSGIPPEVQQKMFEPYYTTKPVGRGTGMGLSVVHGIVHEMHGHILVTSVIGEGSQFTLLFPVDNQSGKEILTMSDDASRNTGNDCGNRRILLVDDEESITGYLSELLEMNDYEVTASNDSQQALSLFLNDPNAFDLVITDMTLPGLTGVELATGMLQVRADLPVILCSGYIDEDTKQAIDDSGIRESFSKPVDSRALIESVGRLLQST